MPAIASAPSVQQSSPSPTFPPTPRPHLYPLHHLLADAAAPLLPVLCGAAAAAARHTRRYFGRQTEVCRQRRDGPAESLLDVLQGEVGWGGAAVTTSGMPARVRHGRCADLRQHAASWRTKPSPEAALAGSLPSQSSPDSG